MKKILLSLGLKVVLTTSIMAQDFLMMATTTSTDNTGLLDYLAPKFEKDTGIGLKWIATGTGKALKIGENCDVDLLFVHAPSSEKKFIEKGFGVERQEVMYNDFVLIGPKQDPIEISKMSPSEALQKIRDKKAKFFSRGDNSGTNKKEISLWKNAKVDTKEDSSWYIQTGQGMLKTIIMAAQKGGYTITDRGTWIKYMSQQGDKNSMKIVVQGDKTMFNQYSVISIDKQRCTKVKAKLAKKFTAWITSPKMQKAISEFRLLGQELFIPNAKK